MVKTILVVDDDPGVTRTVKRGIERLDEDYSVVCADSGEKCLNLLADNQIPDLILLDVEMPDMNGWDVAAKIKKNPKWKNIPLVFLTAKTDTFSQTFGAIVSNDYITKPFEIEKLKERIDKILIR